MKETDHRTPVCKRRLDQVDRYKTGKQEPVRAEKVAKQQRTQNETTSD
jgi:hypothetical protein